jgi:small GTP-binding protein
MDFGADIKILIVGNTSTGKTSYVERYTTGTFKETYKATIISEYKYKIIKINNKIYRIHLWDLGGQDKNIYISKLLLKDSNGILIFSDVNRKNTIDDMLNWKNFFKEYNNFTFFKEETPIIGIFNKCDLLNNNIDDESFVDNFINKNYFDNNFKTSAKDNINIEESMNYIINKIIDLLNKKSELYENNSRESILINKKNNNNINKIEQKKEKCC